MNSLILASQSPRRKELLENLHVPFIVEPSNVEEVVDHALPPEKVVMSLAIQKATDVATSHPDHCVIGADTIVVFDDRILGKPKDENEAFETLKMLSGSSHDVLTGVAIVQNAEHHVFFEKTNVMFWELQEDEIAKYIQSGGPFDKAGSYGIQDALSSLFVKQIHGDFYSVVGLPIARLAQELKSFGYR